MRVVEKLEVLGSSTLKHGGPVGAVVVVGQRQVGAPRLVVRRDGLRRDASPRVDLGGAVARHEPRELRRWGGVHGDCSGGTRTQRGLVRE